MQYRLFYQFIWNRYQLLMFDIQMIDEPKEQNAEDVEQYSLKSLKHRNMMSGFSVK